MKKIKKLTKKQLSLIPRSFDVVGSIIIFADFPEELKSKEKLIAQTLLDIHPNIKTIAKKTGQDSGRYRTPKLKIISGKRTKETVYKETGTKLKLNVEKVYFSVRLSTERKRIAEQVKDGESILVMFSGVAVYPLVISKNSKAEKIVGIEINPAAHKYAIENLKLNKIKNIELILGDVRKKVPKLKTKFDRIIMPLPRGAEDFLDIALSAIKKKGIIHFYDFLRQEEIPQAAIEKIGKACKKAGKKYKILNHIRCGQFSPGTFRVCVDFRAI